MGLLSSRIHVYQDTGGVNSLKLVDLLLCMCMDQLGYIGVSIVEHCHLLCLGCGGKLLHI